MHKGSCLCGSVQFHVDAELPPADACHCTMCRKLSGHYLVSTDVPRDALKIDKDEGLKWYKSSERARRGFCGKCGSTLFYDPYHMDWIAISMGSFDKPTGTELELHMYVADKGDYYEINDDLPKCSQEIEDH